MYSFIEAPGLIEVIMKWDNLTVCNRADHVLSLDQNFTLCLMIGYRDGEWDPWMTPRAPLVKWFNLNPSMD